MPTLRSARMSAEENGITAHGSTKPSTTRYGASLNSRASASSGMMSSLSTCLAPSASHCSEPLGPTRLGPTRDWMRAHTRRSTQLTIPAKGKATPRKTTALNTNMKAAYTRSRGGFFPNSPAAIRLLIQFCISALAIDLRRDDVETSDQHDQVRDHQPAAQLLNHAHRSEGTSTHVDPPRIAAAVAHHVPSLVTARAFHPHLAFAGRRTKVAHHLREHRT